MGNEKCSDARTCLITHWLAVFIPYSPVIWGASHKWQTSVRHREGLCRKILSYLPGWDCKTQNLFWESLCTHGVTWDFLFPMCIFYFCLFLALKIKPRALSRLSKCCPSKLYSHTTVSILNLFMLCLLADKCPPSPQSLENSTPSLP